MVNTICMILSFKLDCLLRRILYLPWIILQRYCKGVFNALILAVMGVREYLMTDCKFYILLYGLRNQYQR